MDIKHFEEKKKFRNVRGWKTKIKLKIPPENNWIELLLKLQVRAHCALLDSIQYKSDLQNVLIFFLSSFIRSFSFILSLTHIIRFGFVSNQWETTLLPSLFLSCLAYTNIQTHAHTWTCQKNIAYTNTTITAAIVNAERSSRWLDLASRSLYS